MVYEITIIIIIIIIIIIRDWSKSIGGGGPEQRGGWSRGFDPLQRGGSCNFQLPLGGGSPHFIT